jgi:TPP-dependent pyruvate/acetoin dehydrogenase alpha subunit
MQHAVGNPAQIEAIEARVEAELEAAVEFAARSPEPDVEEFLAGIPD